VVRVKLSVLFCDSFCHYISDADTCVTPLVLRSTAGSFTLLGSVIVDNIDDFYTTRECGMAIFSVASVCLVWALYLETSFFDVQVRFHNV